MRVTSNMLSLNFLGGINQSLNRMLENNQQIAKNRTLLAPNNDPVRISQALSFQNSIDLFTQYQRNISNAQTWLNLSDGSLQSMSSILQMAKNNYALAGASDSMSPDARKALANDVEAMRNELISLGNTKHLDRYIFGGYQTRDEPFQERKQEIEIIRQGSYIGTAGAGLYTKGVFSDLPELPKGDYEILISYDENSKVATVSMTDSQGRAVSLDSNGSDNSGNGKMNNLTTVSRYQVNPGDFIDTGRGVAIEIPKGFTGGQRIQFSYSPGDSLSYLGDDGLMKAQVGVNDQVNLNVPGNNIFSQTAKQIETTFVNFANGAPIKNITLFKDIDNANVQKGDTISFNGFDHSGNRIGAARIMSPKAALLDHTKTTAAERSFSLYYGNNQLDGVTKNITIPQNGYASTDRLAFAMQTAINEAIASQNNHPVYFSGGMNAAGAAVGPLYDDGLGTVNNRLFTTGNIAYDQYKQITIKAVNDADIGTGGPVTFQIFGFDEKTQYTDTGALNSASASFLGEMTIDNPQVGFKYSIKDDGIVSGTDFGLNIGFLGGQTISAGMTFDFAAATEPAVDSFAYTGGGGNLDGLLLSYDNLRYNGSAIQDIVFSSAGDLDIPPGGNLNYFITTDTGTYSGSLTLGPDVYQYPVEIPGTGATIRLDQSVGNFSFSGGATATYVFDNTRTLSPNLNISGYTGDGETLILRARSAVTSGGTFQPGNYSAAGTIDFNLGGGFFDVMDNFGNVKETVYISGDGRTSLSNGVQISFDPNSVFEIGQTLSFNVLPQDMVNVRSDGSNILFESLDVGEDITMSIFADPMSKLGLDQNVITAQGANIKYVIDPEKPVEDMLRFVENLYGNTIDAYITENGKLAFVDLHAGPSRLEVNVSTNNEGVRHVTPLTRLNPLGGQFNDYYISGNYTARDDNRWNISLHMASGAGTAGIVGMDEGILLTIEDKYGNKLLENYSLDPSTYYGQPISVANGLNIRIPMGTAVTEGLTTSEIALKGNGSLAFGSSATTHEGYGVDIFRSLTNLEDALNLDIGQPGIKAPSEWAFGSTTVPAMMGDFTGNYNTQWTFDIDKIYASSESTEDIKRQMEYTRRSDLSSADGTISAFDSTTGRYHLSAMGSLQITYYNPPSANGGGNYVTTQVHLSSSPSGGIFSSLQEIEDYINSELKKDSTAVANNIQVSFKGSQAGDNVMFSVTGNGNTNIQGVTTSSPASAYGTLGYDNGLFGGSYASAGGTASKFDFELNFNGFEVDQRTMRIPFGDEVISIAMEDYTKSSSAAATLKLDFTRNEDGTMRTTAEIQAAIATSLQMALDEHFGGEGKSPIEASIVGLGTNADPFSLQLDHGGVPLQGLDDTHLDLFGKRRPGAAAEMTVYDFKGDHVRRITVNTAHDEVFVRDGVSLSLSEGSLVAKDKFTVAMGTGAASEVGQLERALDQVLDSLASVGSTSHRIELLDQRYENTNVMQKEFTTKALGGTMEDMVAVATKLEQNRIAYESALAVHGNTSRLSLLNYI
ncbi:hypothetical protein Selin_1963 [Desulfurispirillum indicum S5]|uniref:Flagellin N-terminal domain-containing protein n=1 Tax=Desulfurispirillum indicum (strain ATCC BAA-1389 / DSM 22839 / S5) TaxID=653733 RepID=E6W2E0_DESIS|nr:hypothetical protein [Desulfurispirillum indicum]ADU66690.1 hypothetical protein Selin_1963 [Desulfurispirillum indicum S5]